MKMNNKNCQRVVYQLHGLPAGIFGEAYAVVTAMEHSPGLFRTEQFILTQRPVEAMKIDVFEINGKSFPEELAEINIDFVMLEGKNRAEFLVSLLLEDRVNELGRPDLALSNVEFTERPSPFVGCKMRGRFVKQFTEMKEATKCSTFSYYLSLLDQVAVVVRP